MGNKLKYIDFNELKAIQLNIMDQIDSFCRQNNIKYAIDYGSLIGAVRHKGFIPWDDDIDISMPRDDYERFIKTFNALDSPYKVYYESETPEYTFPFAKVCDIRTIMDEYMYKKRVIGVYVDVFPQDIYEPSSNSIKHVQCLTKISNAKLFVWSKNRSFFKNFCMSVVKILLLPIAISQINKLIYKEASKYNSKKTGYLDCLVSCDIGLGGIMREELFNNLVDYPFEGRHYLSYQNYDERLKKLYGNYMQLPPIEKQISHHTYKAWWR